MRSSGCGLAALALLAGCQRAASRADAVDKSGETPAPAPAIEAPAPKEAPKQTASCPPAEGTKGDVHGGWTIRATSGAGGARVEAIAVPGLAGDMLRPGDVV